MYIGVDMGGTNIRAALVNERGIVKKVSILCPARSSKEEVMEALAGLISQVFTKEVEGIGVGVPSVVDREAGVVYDVANIRSWDRVELAPYLSSRFHVPIYLNNDANCFALGVSHWGEGKAYRNFLGVTLGTGVGAGIIINGKLYNGHNTCAGEIGNLPFDTDNFEEKCSGSFFQHAAGKSGKDLEALARQGDTPTMEVWGRFGRNIGCLVKAITLTYDPEAVFFGGSIAKAFDLFAPSMRRELADFPYPTVIRRLVIGCSQLPDAALLGAASLCVDERKG